MTTSASTLMLPDGRAIGFRGKIDRIDELPDGTLVVTDHKSGRPDKLGSVSADDPTLGGRRFQLPVYAAAARALLGPPKAPVRAGYTYFRPKFTRDRAGARRRCGSARRRRARPSRRRHRGGSVPGDPRASEVDAVQLLLVLRSRRPRHGAAVGGLGAQAVRSRARRPVPARRRGRQTPMAEQLTLLDDRRRAGPPAGQPPDQAARDRIRTDTATTLFVEAGAGAGKTTALVARILTLVDEGVPIDVIAAITFTEKAAAELRHRLRARARPSRPTGRCAKPRSTASTTPRSARCTPSPGASCSSSPSRPGCLPGFDVLDELESQLALDERWEDLLDELLDDAERQPVPGLTAAELVQLLGWGIVPRHARACARSSRTSSPTGTSSSNVSH